jgi:hypothetical protein
MAKTYCNARKRRHEGDLKKRSPDTEHAGEGYCKMETDGGRCRHHGKDAGRNPSHGLYSEKREELEEHYREMAEEKDSPGVMWPEVEALRDLMYGYLEGVQEEDEVTGDMLQDVAKIQKRISRTVDKIHQQRMRERPTEAEVKKLVTGMGSIIQKFVPDGQQSDAIQELRSLAGDGRGGRLPSGRQDGEG